MELIDDNVASEPAKNRSKKNKPKKKADSEIQLVELAETVVNTTAKGEKRSYRSKLKIGKEIVLEPPDDSQSQSKHKKKCGKTLETVTPSEETANVLFSTSCEKHSRKSKQKAVKENILETPDESQFHSKHKKKGGNTLESATVCCFLL